MEIFTRVLSNYLVPKGEIESFTRQIRSDGYEMLRSVEGKARLGDLTNYLDGQEITVLKVPPYSCIVSKTPLEMDLRRIHGITLLAVRRKGQTLPNPGADFDIQAEDELIVFGSFEAVNALGERIHSEQDVFA